MNVLNYTYSIYITYLLHLIEKIGGSVLDVLNISKVNHKFQTLSYSGMNAQLIYTSDLSPTDKAKSSDDDIMCLNLY